MRGAAEKFRVPHCPAQMGDLPLVSARMHFLARVLSEKRPLIKYRGRARYRTLSGYRTRAAVRTPLNSRNWPHVAHRATAALELL